MRACMPVWRIVALAGALLVNAEGKAGPSLDEPLSFGPPDAVNGARIVADRRKGLCVLCHLVPGGNARMMGTLAPSLAGVGGRLSVGELRLRLVDSRRIDAGSIMPPYFSSNDLSRVATEWQGRTALSAAEIEDVVAYLATLKE